jgi:hypothetical protein
MGNTNNKNRFGVPQGYFDTFEKRLELRLMEEQLPKKTGFLAPDNYFNDLDERLLLNSTSKNSPKIRWLGTSSRWWVAAAAVAIVFFMVYSPWNSNELPLLSELSPETIELYIDNGGLDYETHEIMALMTDEQLDTLDMEEQWGLNEQLEDYLLERIEYNHLITE